MKPNNLLYFSILFLTIILISCNSSECVKECQDAKLECNCCPVADTAAQQKPSLQNITVFLETSGSMRGYMPNSGEATSFQKAIPSIISKLREYNPTFFSIKESSQKTIPLPVGEVASKITRGDFPWGNFTSLPAMLDTIHPYQHDNSVSILISDMIYSPEEKRMTSQSITELAERFNKKKGIAASLLILTSDFRISGKTPTPQSPYYILLQGKPENIEAVKTKIKESPIVSGLVVDEANFGYTYPEPYYSILPFAELSSGLPQVCTGEKENYKVINNIESGDSIGFWLGLDLSKLPSYSQQADFLRNNISFNSELAKYDSILTKSDFLKTLDDETDKSIAANCTHFIHMRVEEMEGKTLFVKLQFRNNQPTWIQTYNHSDDSQADINRSQTFGLANIYTALRDAYGEKPDQPFFKELQITLVKK